MVNNFAPGIYSVLSRLHVYNIILHQVIYIALVSHVTLVSKKWIFNKKNLYHLHTKLSFVLTVIWGAVSFTKEKKKTKNCSTTTGYPSTAYAMLLHVHMTETKFINKAAKNLPFLEM